jgi:F0F1-type ATP synthase epsilon subunit
MAGHIPFVTSVKPCDCKIELEDGTEKYAHTDGGILTVSNEKVVFLSGAFNWKE